MRLNCSNSLMRDEPLLVLTEVPEGETTGAVRPPGTYPLLEITGKKLGELQMPVDMQKTGVNNRKREKAKSLRAFLPLQKVVSLVKVDPKGRESFRDQQKDAGIAEARITKISAQRARVKVD